MPVIEAKGAASSGGFGQFARQVAANYIENVFSTYLYTSDFPAVAKTITNGVNLSSNGGMVWIKCRSHNLGVSSHVLVDTARGAQKVLSMTSGSEVTDSESLTAFNSTGFSIGTQVQINAGYGSYVSWTFRNQPKFFDVVTYTGNATLRDVSHSLGSVPGAIFIHARNASGTGWLVYHRSVGTQKFMVLNTTDAQASSSNWMPTAPTSTTFPLSAALANSAATTYVAYLFAHDAGGFGASGTDNVISCGSYTGNGSASGPTVTLGWEPQWLMIKNASGTGSWQIIDSMRGMPVGSADNTLQANASSVESALEYLSPTATGFQITSTSSEVNTNAETYIYVAIRRGPMRTPTSGTSVFGMQTYSDGSLGSAAPIVLGSSVGFPVDTAIAAIRTSGAANITKYVGDRLRGRPELKTPSTDAESNTDIQTWAWQSGVQVSTAGNWYYEDGSAGSRTFVGYFFRRAPGFFDVVCYTGDGTNPRYISHNLGVVPEFIIVKRRGTFTQNWLCYHASLGFAYRIDLNSNGAAVIPGFAWYTTFTATQFNTQLTPNSSGETYIAYLFASCPGVSKVGSYTGTGAAQTINCGFTGGARFVLIKRTDSTGDWYVWDTARGISAGNDPYLLLNSTAAEVTATDYISVQSSGFGLTVFAPNALNANGGTFIYLAIA